MVGRYKKYVKLFRKYREIFSTHGDIVFSCNFGYDNLTKSVILDNFNVDKVDINNFSGYFDGKIKN